MKLRISNNSIRLRLSQSDVEIIGQGQPVCESLTLGKEQVFHYSLLPCQKADAIQAKINAQKLEVTLPISLASKWASTDEVTLRHVQNQDSDLESIILIEKDFQCLHQRPDEDESDNFPNPKTLEDYENCDS